MTMSAQHKSQDSGHRGPTGFDRYLQQQYADWFRKDFHWNLYVTLTFSYDLTSGRANAVLGTYLRAIEREVEAPLACLIAEERGPSAMGKGLGRVHFHLLIRCAKPLDPVQLTDVWREDRFGGDRTVGPSPVVLRYEKEISAAFYLMKGLRHPEWGLSLWRLEGASQRKPKSFATSKETRRMWSRSVRSGMPPLRHSCNPKNLS